MNPLSVFIDTETSGLVRHNVPLTDPQQPWACQIAADLCDDTGKSHAFFSTRILADGRKIKADAEAAHGISSAMAGRTGVGEIVAIGMLAGLIAQAVRVVGHGLTIFDQLVIEGVLMRRGKDARLFRRVGLEFVDTMLVSTAFCKVAPATPRDDGGYKWPTLDEACKTLLGMAPREGQHDAWDDCQRMKALFFNLKSRGAIEGLAA